MLKGLEEDEEINLLYFLKCQRKNTCFEVEVISQKPHGILGNTENEALGNKKAWAFQWLVIPYAHLSC